MKITTKRHSFATYISGSIAILLLLVCVFTYTYKQVHATTLMKVTNPTFLFRTSDAKNFTVNSASGDINWEVKDVDGKSIDSGTTTPTGNDTTITTKQLPIGSYSVDLTDTEGSTSIQFGVIGETPAPNPYFGVQSHTLGQIGYGEKNIRWRIAWNNPTMVIQNLQRLGVGTIRDEYRWKHFERKKGSYEQFDDAKKHIEDIKNKDIELFWIAGSRNEFYNDKKIPSTDEGRKAFAKYVDAYLVQNPLVKKVEIINEINIKKPEKSDCTTGDCYKKIVEAVYNEVKPKHPDVMLYAGGIAGYKDDFFKDFIDAGGDAFADGYSYHPYGFTPESLIRDIDKLNEKVKAVNNGKTKPIVFSEIGWSLMPKSLPRHAYASVTTESLQAARIIHGYVAPLSRPNVESVIHYDSVNDAELLTLDTKTDSEKYKNIFEANFGMFKAPAQQGLSVQPKQAAIAFYVLRTQLDGFTYNRTEIPAKGTIDFVFSSKDGEERHILWNTAEFESQNETNTISVTLSVASEKSVKVTSMLGKELQDSMDISAINLDLTSSPVYVSVKDKPTLNPDPKPVPDPNPGQGPVAPTPKPTPAPSPRPYPVNSPSVGNNNSSIPQDNTSTANQGEDDKENFASHSSSSSTARNSVIAFARDTDTINETIEDNKASSDTSSSSHQDSNKTNHDSPYNTTDSITTPSTSDTAEAATESSSLLPIFAIVAGVILIVIVIFVCYRLLSK